MKKLQKLLLLAIFSIGIFGAAKAQIVPDNTQNGVVVGGNFTYSVPEVADHTWTWEVIDNNGDPVAGGDYTLIDVTPAVDYSKNITWNTNGTFYVRVTAENTLTNCTNNYVIQVDVATNDYTVAYNAATVKTYCADDLNISTGLEIALDMTLNGLEPADSYYDMTVHYKIDGNTTKLATLNTDDKFNIDGITIADPVNPAMASITVTIVKIVDVNGVEFSPAAGNEDLTITIHAIPSKPTITF